MQSHILGGTKSWVQRITIQGRRRHLGLGGWPVVSIEKARRKAFENRVAVSDGRDPYAERQEQKSLSYEDVHDALKEIDQVEGVSNSARWCLQFVILVGVQSFVDRLRNCPQSGNQKEGLSFPSPL